MDFSNFFNLENGKVTYGLTDELIAFYVAEVFKKWSKNIILVTSNLYESNKLSKEVVEKVNKRLKVLVDNYGFEFVDISEVINNKDYYLLKNSYYLNYKGHQYIYELVKEVV